MPHIDHIEPEPDYGLVDGGVHWTCGISSRLSDLKVNDSTRRASCVPRVVCPRTLHSVVGSVLLGRDLVSLTCLQFPDICGHLHVLVRVCPSL